MRVHVEICCETLRLHHFKLASFKDTNVDDKVTTLFLPHPSSWLSLALFPKQFIKKHKRERQQFSPTSPGHADIVEIPLFILMHVPYAPAYIC